MISQLHRLLLPFLVQALAVHSLNRAIDWISTIKTCWVAYPVEILVMQCFRVVYHGISHESLVFSGTHTSLQVSVYTNKIPSDECDITWLYHEECCITISYHAIENTVVSMASIINAKYVQTWMVLKWLPNVHPVESVFKPFQTFCWL